MIAIVTSEKLRPRLEDHLGLAADFVFRNFGRKQGRILIPKGGKPNSRGTPVEDTEEYSIAVEALWAAIEHYDPDTGFKFSTYARRCIRNAFFALYRKRTVPLELVDPKTIEVTKENCTSERDPEALLKPLLADSEDDKEYHKLDKEMMLKHYLEQLTLEEIGRIYGVGKNRVKQRIDRAIATIQHKIEGE